MALGGGKFRDGTFQNPSSRDQAASHTFWKPWLAWLPGTCSQQLVFRLSSECMDYSTHGGLLGNAARFFWLELSANPSLVDLLASCKQGKLVANFAKPVVTFYILCKQ